MSQEIQMTEESLSFDLLHPEPLMIVISGPSGVGKDAVIRTLQQRLLPLSVIVTMTSRPPRDDEVDGVDYFFVSKAEFEARIAADEFFEHAIVYQDYKGIPKKGIMEALASNQDMILRVDVQGAETVRRLFPEAVLIFLIPTSESEWLHRLQNRKTETAENLALRLETAREELKQLPRFDYVVVNAHERLQETVNTIVSIIDAEHHRVEPRKLNL
jgi:guanylate kinase